MIARLWHGWTSESNSEAYASLLTATVLPKLTRNDGCHGAYVLRRRTECAEVEYTVLMLFDDEAAVKRMAGPDCERSVVPPEARGLLSRYDERVVHYDTVMVPVGCRAERVTPPERPRFRWFW
ncbi:MAG TPA: hypothetical protein VIY50_04430 [Steroidobacteraceae bacterium]